MKRIWKKYEIAQKKLEAEKKFNLHKEAALKAGLALRTDLHIVGPPEFMRSTYRVLDELKDKAPNRYQEVIQYLPQAVYESYLFPSASGTSCGEFSLDGSGNDIGQVNTYKRFRFVFLHEAGHNVKFKQNHDGSQEEANEYAYQVISELNASTPYLRNHPSKTSLKPDARPSEDETHSAISHWKHLEDEHGLAC